ncbi:hypothetical protein ACOSQ3_025912 [Xanthoceras sorbifolium]
MGVGQGICSNGSFEKKSLCKISDFRDSPSLFSEPPDVKNWSSSYVYESPVLDTSDVFGDFLHLERDPKEGKKEEKLEIKQVRSVHEEFEIENVHSIGILEHNIYHLSFYIVPLISMSTHNYFELNYSCDFLAKF